MNKLVVLATLSTVFSLGIHPKGTLHRKWVTDCLESVVANQFHFLREEGNTSFALLLSILASNNMAVPAFEIQSDLIGRINRLMKLPTEVIESIRREFSSHDYLLECDDCDYNETVTKRVFVEEYKAYFTIMVVDKMETFEEKLKILTQLRSFDPKNIYFIYFAKFVINYKLVALTLLERLWDQLIYNSVVMIPRNPQQFDLFRLKLSFAEGQYCGSEYVLHNLDVCYRGVIQNNTKHYFSNRLSRSFKQCILNVVAMPYKPYVINATSGLEIVVLKNLGRAMDLTLEVLIMKQAVDWGEKLPDGYWTGGLGIVYNYSMVGLGNLAADEEWLDDFDFTVAYFEESLVWVVPVAAYVPKWRVLMVIFDAKVWAVCLATLIVYAICFFFASKTGNDYATYKNLSLVFFTSFQITITSVTNVQPKLDLNRVLFYTFAIYSIVISSLYTSSLILFLKSPIRDHQIDSTTEILDSTLKIGGLESDREKFEGDMDEEENDSENAEIFARYETGVENDTVQNWLNRVANHRDTCMVTSRFYVNYLLSQSNNITNDAQGRPKVYCFSKPLMSYSLSMVLKKGFPLLRIFNKNLQRMVEAGLVNKWASKYHEAIKKQQYLEDHRDEGPESLKPEHLQGAFALLIFGYVGGTLSLIGEIVTRRVKKNRAKKLKPRKFVKAKRQ